LASGGTADVTAIAAVITAALATGAVLWAGRCGLVFHRIEHEVDERLEKHQTVQESKLADAISVIIRAFLGDLLDLYLDEEEIGPPPRTPEQLEAAAQAMQREPELADLHAHRMVTRPVSIALVKGVVAALPDLAPKLSNQIDTYDSILRLRCLIRPYQDIQKSARLLAWRFGLQCLALLVALAGVSVALFDPDAQVPAAVLATLALAHGVATELSFHGLNRRIDELDPLLSPAVR
jgi:hypothetical protein